MRVKPYTAVQRRCVLARSRVSAQYGSGEEPPVPSEPHSPGASRSPFTVLLLVLCEPVYNPAPRAAARARAKRKNKEKHSSQERMPIDYRKLNVMKYEIGTPQTNPLTNAGGVPLTDWT